jgi:DnaK suppressor protein
MRGRYRREGRDGCYRHTRGSCSCGDNRYRDKECLDPGMASNGQRTLQERTMVTTDFTIHRERLLALRARLRGDMTQMEDTALNKKRSETSHMPNHMAELGTDNFEQEITLNLLGNEKDVLDQIEAALERIEEGHYGRCDECGRKIPAARLEAMPYVAICVQCASQHERRLPR